MRSDGDPDPALPRRRRRAAWIAIAAGVPLLAVLLALSASVGMADIDPGTVLRAVLHPDPDVPQHVVVREMRLPRAVVAILVGASLAVAGAVLQGVTRNHLASPSILGINAGAAFTLACAFAFFGGAPLHVLMVVSMAGAAIGVVAVHAIGAAAPGGLTPVRLVLAGAAVAALLSSLTAGLVIYFDVYQDLLFFQAGGVAGVRWMHVRALLPWAGGGLLCGLLLAPSVSVLHLGEEAATGLGLATRRVRALCTVVVVVLAGAAVSVAGPVGFVGLVVPHIARLLFGADDRVVVPGSMVLGGVLLSIADILARVLHPNREVPLGMVTALVGVPVFLWLVLRKRETPR